MSNVFVWTLGDVMGLVVLGIIALVFLGVMAVGAAQWAKAKMKGWFKS